MHSGLDFSTKARTVAPSTPDFRAALPDSTGIWILNIMRMAPPPIERREPTACARQSEDERTRFSVGDTYAFPRKSEHVPFGRSFFGIAATSSGVSLVIALTNRGSTMPSSATFRSRSMGLHTE